MNTADSALVVMAAGIGNRYGGLKQIDPIGPHGEILLDYAIYDALRAGFGRIVFVIRRDLESAFRERIGRAIERHADTAYVFQGLDAPSGHAAPAGRQKPWGTGHAVLCCRDAVQSPFAAINADDWYGTTAFQAMSQHLRQARDQDGVYDYGMVGYLLSNTLSEHGHVARGVCQVTPDGFLVNIRERTHIEQKRDGIAYTENGADWTALSPDSIVSMNMWGFTPSILAELASRFPLFLNEHQDDLLKAEYFLPDIVGALVQEGKARVKVLPTREKWFGLTYRQDVPRVQSAIRELVKRGIYPEKLWDEKRAR